jgi:hypothetical protein
MPVAALNDPDARNLRTRGSMTYLSEWRRKRYAEDPDYREKMHAYGRAYARRHREQINERVRQKRRSDAEFRERERAHAWQARWRKIAGGVTTEDYDRMLMQQHGACAICKQKPDERLCVDHCHATDEVRGLLCRKCNAGLGFYDDDSNRLREAADYVDARRGLPES